MTTTKMRVLSVPHRLVGKYSKGNNTVIFFGQFFPFFSFELLFCCNLFFAFLLLCMTKYTMWRPYMDYFNC